MEASENQPLRKNSALWSNTHLGYYCLSSCSRERGECLWRVRLGVDSIRNQLHVTETAADDFSRTCFRQSSRIFQNLWGGWSSSHQSGAPRIPQNNTAESAYPWNCSLCHYRQFGESGRSILELSGSAAEQLSCSPGVWTPAAAAASGLLRGARPGAGHACLSSSEALTLILTVLLSLLRTTM